MQVTGEYKSGVDHFQWYAGEVHRLHSLIWGNRRDVIINEIVQGILSAQRQLPTETNSTFTEAMISIKVGTDNFSLKNTLLLIINASQNVKKELKLLWNEISTFERFKDLNETDLKCATLLFGIERVSAHILYWESKIK